MRTTKKRLPIVENDNWLEPVEEQMQERFDTYQSRLRKIKEQAGSLVDFANGYLYFGFQYDSAAQGWWFREWLPGAWHVYLFGEFNQWQRTELPLNRGAGGVWSLFLPDSIYGDRLVHGSKVKMLVHGENGFQERIPAYIRRVVQDEINKDFCGVLWAPPTPFSWEGDNYEYNPETPLLIYEAHIGMAQESEGVGSYTQFQEEVLPQIKESGYTAIQLMAVAEHPYYGSFGYHVSNFFAPSSRFGTPEELKALIREAHALGLAVIMDLVHAHYVKNLNEGLNELDGTNHHYSPPGEAGYQPYWDSQLFDYTKDEVVHFLLSNAKYWLDEFHFDGYRFDGVTSMLYTHHGYTEFDAREKYFNDVNRPALTYLTLCNTLIHNFKENAITIAEDVSGMPAMAQPTADGGVGFDYRLAMAVPDFWIRLLKQVPDPEWDIYQMWEMMTNRLGGVKTVAYCESHDQAMVGDQTLAFRLMDKAMYTDMDRTTPSIIIDRGLALHKMIRLFTISLAGDAYLNFMGNEFGHPEWIDFPREGNNWSYAHARRQWSLATNGFLRYSYLGAFDRVMLALVRRYRILQSGFAYNHLMDTDNQTIVFSHHDLLFIFNWHPSRSIADYELPVPQAGRYRVVLSSDELRFGGQERVETNTLLFSTPKDQDEGSYHTIRIYNVCRTALVLRRLKN